MKIKYFFKEQVDKVKYRIVRNNRYFDQTKETACYSYTAIAEISVFALGQWKLGFLGHLQPKKS